MESPLFLDLMARASTPAPGVLAWRPASTTPAVRELRQPRIGADVADLLIKGYAAPDTATGF
ncbi:MAG: hypothetical protein ABSA93_14965 [Streptosporangiaceae bacterium]